MTLQDRIDELVAQHGSLRAVARVTEIDVGYLSRLRAYATVPLIDRLRWLDEIVRFTLLWRAAPRVEMQDPRQSHSGPHPPPAESTP